MKDIMGDYCTACEAYYTEKDAPDKICPTHKNLGSFERGNVFL